jgi:Zn finger protein HypA/HybF involved in hydrogenase expression
MTMSKFECQKCGWIGKPIFMEPATRLCPQCRSIDMKKVKAGK